LRVDYQLADTRNHERILYICRVRLRGKRIDSRHIGIGNHGGSRLLGLGHRIAQLGFQPELLMDDRGQQRNEVLLNVIHIAFVRNAQLQGRSVEIERHDRLEPFGELFVRGLLLYLGQAHLPHVSVCPIFNDHRIKVGYF